MAAHPLRVRLLNLLRERGPSTASKLAELLGQSSGATSYHLRQLAAYGFVEDAGCGTGRERWWQATSARTDLDAATALPACRGNHREPPGDGRALAGRVLPRHRAAAALR
ncbi:winged helix-turn-helix domain-containing protein [Actinoplanes bogorensis]|uniref:Winged helix-turn-helix domain-containing protein n=1 Tax=Paractinoplanes bogorensis TaxID=1610840 RepID=A0ABS5YGB8_9ACTN|nr:winged helix-turn-helix domain-containing protein [Actinoplanes bogorensis]